MWSPLDIYQIPLEKVVKKKLGDSASKGEELYIAKYEFGEPPKEKTH